MKARCGHCCGTGERDLTAKERATVGAIQSVERIAADRWVTTAEVAGVMGIADVSRAWNRLAQLLHAEVLEQRTGKENGRYVVHWRLAKSRDAR